MSGKLPLPPHKAVCWQKCKDGICTVTTPSVAARQVLMHVTNLKKDQLRCREVEKLPMSQHGCEELKHRTVCPSLA